MKMSVTNVKIDMLRNINWNWITQKLLNVFLYRMNYEIVNLLIHLE